MKTTTLFLLVTALFLSSCGKSFTPASKSDLESVTTNVNQKTQVSQTCVNENIFITFEPSEKTRGQITVAANITLESTMQYNLIEKAMNYETQRGVISNGSNSPGTTFKNLRPTVLSRQQSNKMINRAFVKYLCANAAAASLVDYSIEKRILNDKSQNFDYRFDAVNEVWACYGPCTQEGVLWN